MKKVRCAIYTRKSSEEGLEQSFNSLHAQREACAAYVLSQASEGWSLLPDDYDDGGLSGGSLERPALQRLLQHIAEGRIDIVVVYKVDRLTRSLLDFAKLVEAFDKAGTSFVSVTQSFNTTTSMGRLTLNMLLSFAQFEREVTAERIRDKIAASKAKGMWMGGTPPTGYKPDGRSLVIVEEQATIVRDIFRRYLDSGSVRAVAEELKREGIISPVRITGTGRRFGGCPFARGMIYAMLGNPIYISEIRHRGTTYPAPHAPIIDRATWDAVQAQLAGNVQGERRATVAAPSLLAGLIRDEQGGPMVAAHACKKKVRYRYYVTRSLQTASGASKAGSRIPARKIEAAVCQRIAEAFDDPIALLSGAGIPLSGIDLHGVIRRAAEVATCVRGRAANRLQKLVAEVRVQSNSIDIDLCAIRVTALLGAAEPRDNQAITIAAPGRLTRTGRATRLVTGAGAAATSNAPDETLVKLLHKARLWWDRICKDGLSASGLAREEGVNSTYITRVARFAMLSPRLVDEIVSGRQPATLNASRLSQTRELPISWAEQEKLVRSLS